MLPSCSSPLPSLETEACSPHSQGSPANATILVVVGPLARLATLLSLCLLISEMP